MFKEEEKTSYLETIVKITIIFTALFVVFVLPFYWYIKYDIQGVLMYLVLFLLTSPLIAFTFKKFIYFKKDELKNTFLSKKTYVVFIFLINSYVFFTIGLNTLLASHLLIALYAFSYLPVLFHYLKKYFSYLLVLLCSFSISLLLIVNFYFSSNEVEETHSYKLNKANSTIQLKNYAYEEFDGIRIFLVEENINFSGKITYVFADGLLGYRVVKKYKF
jgi:hypothetical protein